MHNFQHRDKPQEAGDGFQQADKKNHLSIKMAEKQTSESRVQGGQGQDICQGDNGVACDKMIIGEDLQMKKQKNNSREEQVSSQRKTQQDMDVYNPRAKEKEYIRQGNWVKPKGRGRFQTVGDSIKVTQVDKYQTCSKADRTSAKVSIREVVDKRS